MLYRSAAHHIPIGGISSACPLTAPLALHPPPPPPPLPFQSLMLNPGPGCLLCPCCVYASVSPSAEPLVSAAPDWSSPAPGFRFSYSSPRCGNGESNTNDICVFLTHDWIQNCHNMYFWAAVYFLLFSFCFFFSGLFLLCDENEKKIINRFAFAGKKMAGTVRKRIAMCFSFPRCVFFSSLVSAGLSA